MNNQEYIKADSDKYVAGVDEVARGTFIGPVISACVVLPHTFPDDKYKEIKDSKKLTEKKRRELAEYIKTIAITYGIGLASVEEIDNINISKSQKTFLISEYKYSYNFLKSQIFYKKIFFLIIEPKN
jgi:ribonuclease HII